MGNQGRSGGFLFGFLIGLALGGGAVFLLGTKRGKNILKTLTEEGFERLSSLEDLLEDELHQSVAKKKKHNGEAKPNGQAKEVPAVPVVTTHPRRFFRGIKKKG